MLITGRGVFVRWWLGGETESVPLVVLVRVVLILSLRDGGGIQSGPFKRCYAVGL